MTSFDKNEVNSLIIDEMNIQDFHFVDLFEKLPETYKDIMNDLTSVM